MKLVRMLPFSLLVLTAVASSPAFAYPIAYRCDNRGQISFPEDPASLATVAPKLDRAALVQGIRNCERDVANTYTLLFGTSAKAPAFPTIDEQASTLELFTRLQGCYTSRRRIDSENQFANFKLPRPRGDFGVHVFYPYDSLFSLISGVRKGKDNPLFKPISYKDLRWVIRDSITYGIDPYLMIAIGVSEQASDINRIERGNHDYHLKQALGCPMSGDTHQIVTDARLESALRGISYNHTARQPADRPTFVCVGKVGVRTQLSHLNGFEIFPEGEKDETQYACCLKVGFELPSRTIDEKQFHFGDRGFIERVMAYRFFEKNLGKVAAGKTDLADAIEEYLIRSAQTGSIAGNLIASFRVGLNSYRDPNYGRVNLDYMLNSLLPHPIISGLVEELNPERKTVPSVFCIGKSAGVHLHDTDANYRAALAARRLEPIEELWRGKIQNEGFRLGLSDVDTHRRYLSVFMYETRSSPTKELLIEKLGADYTRFQSLLYRHARDFHRKQFRLSETQVKEKALSREERLEFDELLRKTFAAYFDGGIYARRRTFGLAAKMDGRGEFTWERKTEAQVQAERKSVLENEAKYGVKHVSRSK